jgi:hypothetical protein
MTPKKTTPFQWAVETFARTRNPSAGKPLSGHGPYGCVRNTRLYRRGEDCYAVRYHQTDVVTLWSDGRITLDTGGWHTMSTKARLDAYAPVRIDSDRGIWYVSHKLGKGRVPYFDGITFTARGRCTNGPSPAQWARYLRERAAMDKRLQTYCTGYNRALAREGLDMPSSGDCWFCAMHTTDDGTPLGDITDGAHLLDHIEESYYVPSLAVNALRAKGYQDAGIYMFLAMDPENGRMAGPGSRYQASDGSMGGNMVRRALLAYLRDRLLPVAPGPNAEQRAPVRGVNDPRYR